MGEDFLDMHVINWCNIKWKNGARLLGHTVYTF